MTDRNDAPARDFLTRAKARIKHLDETTEEIVDELGLPREAKYDLLSAMTLETAPVLANSQKARPQPYINPVAPWPLQKNNRRNTSAWRLRSFTAVLSVVLAICLLVGGYAFLSAMRQHAGSGITGAVPASVVVGSYNGTISALKSSDGSRLWQYRAGHPFTTRSIAIANGIIYAASTDGHVYALQRATGKLLWQHAVSLFTATPGYNVNMNNLGLVAADGFVAVSYTDLPIADPVGVVDVFSGQSGTLLWHTQVIYRQDPLLGMDSTALYLTDTASMDSSLLVTKALRASDGKELWRENQHVISLPSSAGASSLVTLNGILYGYEVDGSGLVALQVQSGQLVWEQKAARDNYLGMLVVGNEKVYLATQNRLCAYRMSNGAQVWCARTRQSSNPAEKSYFEQFEQTVLIGDFVFAGRGAFNPDGFKIEAWDANRGTLRWSWPSTSNLLRADFSWRFTGANGVLYVPTEQGLYAVSAFNGHQLWFASMTIGFGSIVVGI